MQLYIANKNYSSWSLRGWLLLEAFDIEFEERLVPLSDPSFKQTLLALGGPGLVPVLVDGQQVIWDSLAIAEYLAEKFPEAGIWPTDPARRASARCYCAEMHSGFPALRSHMPMNIEAKLPRLGWNVRVQRDIDRVVELWSRARASFGDAGPFLFGDFSAADAFFAPVVFRLVTHEAEVPDAAARYMGAVQNHPAVQKWVAAALEEHDFLAEEEPYRSRRS